MSRKCTLLFAVVFAALLGPAPGQDKKALTIKGWGTWIDPDGDCKVEAKEDKVTITVPTTHHDLSSNDNFTKLNAPRILQKASGDFSLQVKAAALPLPGKDTSSSGFHSFISCGLLVYVDDKNFIRMERAAEGNGGGEFVWVERFTDGKPASRKLHAIANKETALRLQRSGAKLTFSISQDAEAATWTEVHTDDSELPKELQVGVLAINTTTAIFAPELREFKVTAK
jgi:regulation of enolase protein 1 (concanavalin A-like superfamily)